jgi:histidine triad (HIT) family protein
VVIANCPFCQIAAGNLPADILHADDAVVAFRDLNPQAPVHVLVITREHITSVGDLTTAHDHLWGHLLHTAQRIAASEGLEARGYRLLTNVGPEAGQTVAHLHLHLLGGRPMSWPPG